MPAQVVRHLVERTQKFREDRLQRPDDRVLGVGQIERHRAVVGVDDDLHRVADVVDPGGGPRRIRILVADRVGVQDPDQLAVRDDQVRVVVVAEEWGNRGHAVDDVPVIQDPTGRADLAAEQDVRGPEPGREPHPAQQPGDLDPAGPVIHGGDVFVPLRVVELFGVGVHDDVVVRQLAEVDARLVYGDVHRRGRRQVLDEQHRQPFLGDLVDRAHRDPEAVGVLQLLVDPGRVWQAVRVQLAA